MEEGHFAGRFAAFAVGDIGHTAGKLLQLLAVCKKAVADAGRDNVVAGRNRTPGRPVDLAVGCCKCSPLTTRGLEDGGCTVGGKVLRGKNSMTP